MVGFPGGTAAAMRCSNCAVRERLEVSERCLSCADEAELKMQLAWYEQQSQDMKQGLSSEESDSRRLPDAEQLQRLEPYEIPTLKCEGLGEVRMWIIMVENTLNAYSLRKRYLDRVIINWAARSLEGLGQWKWRRSEAHGTLPTTWEQFKDWLKETPPFQQGLRAAECWMEAKQRPDQSCRNFYYSMLKLARDLVEPFSPRLTIDFVVAKMLPAVRREFMRMADPPYTFDRFENFCLRINIFRLEIPVCSGGDGGSGAANTSKRSKANRARRAALKRRNLRKQCVD